MGYSIGYDSEWQRDVGYDVPAICDAPDCTAAIDRGLAYVCGGEPFGGEHGCGLYFCSDHLFFAVNKRPSRQLCTRCLAGEDSYPAKPDTVEWIQHKLTDPSWQEWRTANPADVKRLADLAREKCQQCGIDARLCASGIDSPKYALPCCHRCNHNHAATNAKRIKAVPAAKLLIQTYNECITPIAEAFEWRGEIDDAFVDYIKACAADLKRLRAVTDREVTK